MTLPIAPPFLPMEAETADELPVGANWQYEPKWDGFRCLAFKEADRVDLQSKSAKPLSRYFPELVEALRDVQARRFVLDGEIAIQVEGRLSFDDLLMRIHPAASRIRKLAQETPATYIVFDLLLDERGRSLVHLPLSQRRARLDAFAARYLGRHPRIRVSPATGELKMAKAWLRKSAGDLDGIIAKRLDLPYQSGERSGMIKVKQLRTADCVVGGFRYGTKGGLVGSLLLGLYDEEGRLNHVGFTSGIRDSERARITREMKSRIEPPGFTGNAPGGPSRWSTRRSTEWEPVRPEVVVEVEYDHFSGGRFRHGTRLVRFRPDKDPRRCTLDQVHGGLRRRGR